jgi:hypothetical protein
MSQHSNIIKNNNVIQYNNIQNDNIMQNTFNCKLCNYNSNTKGYYLIHCNSKKHLEKENLNLVCIKCNKSYTLLTSLQKHRKRTHNKKKNNKNENNNNDNKNNIIIDKTIDKTFNKTIGKTSDYTIDKTFNKTSKIIIDKIDKSNKKIDNVNNNINEVKITVNKAIYKASSLIKYLMQYHPDVPSIKKITDKQCIDRLRTDLNCSYLDKDKYLLQKVIINKYKNGLFIESIYESILKLLNHKNINLQPIYNTDSARNNYIIKTRNWNNDTAGVKFTEYVIKPFLDNIMILLKEYKEFLENNNINNKNNNNKNILKELSEYTDTMLYISNIEMDIIKNWAVKPLLNKLTPFLRYFEEEIERFNTLEELQKELTELDKFNNF